MERAENADSIISLVISADLFTGKCIGRGRIGKTENCFLSSPSWPLFPHPCLFQYSYHFISGGATWRADACYQPYIHPRSKRPRHTGDILIFQHREYRISFPIAPHAVETAGQSTRGAWIVGHIKHRDGPPGQNLKSSWPCHVQ